MSSPSPSKRSRVGKTRVVRCLLNGCYDLLHFGHLNALRQVKQYRFDSEQDLQNVIAKCKLSDEAASSSDLENVKSELGHQGISFFRSEQGDIRFLSEDFLDELLHRSGIEQWRRSDLRVHVVAGIHSNDEIRRVKGGAFINSEQEKERLLLACKFVDEVVHDVPYGVIYPEKFNCDLSFHGDDEIMIPREVVLQQRALGPWEKALLDEPLKHRFIDMYGHAKERGVFKYIRRTEGISTTLMVNRFFQNSSKKEQADSSSERDVVSPAELPEYVNPTANRFNLFYTPTKKAGKRIVYVEGHWDLFHIGYLDILEAMRKQSVALLNQIRSANTETIDDSSVYVIVGVLPDFRGRYECIQSLHERALCLLSLKIVDDVVLQVQNPVDERFRRSLGIDLVASVLNHPDFVGRSGSDRDAEIVLDFGQENNVFTRQTILDRFEASRQAFVERQNHKIEPELTEVKEKSCLSS